MTTSTPHSILEDALKAQAKTDLVDYLEPIEALREKNWSWRDIASFLKERGVETDHTKLIRFMSRQARRWVVPGAGDYLDALRALRSQGGLKGFKWAMLMSHYRAHNRTTTYTELARAAEEAGAVLPQRQPHTFANLEYGKLGKALGQAVGMEFLPSGKRDAPFYSSAIGVGSNVTPEGADFELVMHHELAKALDQLLREDSEHA